MYELSEQEFHEFVAAKRLHVQKQVAQQFFLRISHQAVQDSIGASILWQKLTIWCCLVGGPLVFVASLAAIVWRYGGWEASLIIPIAGICWTVFYGLTSDQGGWLAGTVPLALSLGLTFVTGDQFSVIVFLFILSLWIQRTGYLLAKRWLEQMVSDSYAAYLMLEHHVTFDDPD